jgi:hypothetical protein
MKKEFILFCLVVALHFTTAQHIKFPTFIVEEPAPNKTIAFGPGLTEGIAGELGNFTIETRDANGNPCCFEGGVTFSVFIWRQYISPTDNKNGTYSVSL